MKNGIIKLVMIMGCIVSPGLCQLSTASDTC